MVDAASLSDATLVVIDVQRAIDEPTWGPRNNPGAELVIAELLGAWRARSLSVVHVRHDSTEADSPYRADRPTNAFKPEAAPIDGELVVAKSTNSAFIGTELEQRLRADGGPVVFAGVLTHNSLEATVRTAGNLGFESVVVADACWSVDVTDRRGVVWMAEDVHQLSLAHLDGEYATVLDSADVLAAISR